LAVQIGDGSLDVGQILDVFQDPFEFPLPDVGLGRVERRATLSLRDGAERGGGRRKGRDELDDGARRIAGGGRGRGRGRETRGRVRRRRRRERWGRRGRGGAQPVYRQEEEEEERSGGNIEVCEREGGKAERSVDSRGATSAGRGDVAAGEEEEEEEKEEEEEAARNFLVGPVSSPQ